MTISNRNKKYKRNGSILASVMVAAIVWIMIAQSMFITFSGQFKMISSSRTALQAQQYAEIALDKLKNINYDELDVSGAHGRKKIEGISSDDWQDEVTIGAESTIAGSDDAKQRIATVNVYKVGDTLPRYTVELPLSSQGNNTLPIGTILPYVGELSKIPHGWALCDGTNGTPNLTGRFLQGWGWDDFYNRYTGEYIQEGLPNIYGRFPGGANSDANGAFKYIQPVFAFAHLDTHSYRDYMDIDFNAARCSWLYGNSLTIQPRAFVVYYIMRII